MSHKATFEEKRLQLQAELDDKKTSAARNRLGQFATPTALALDILQYAKSLLKPDEPVRFLDPAIGTGAFYSALIETFPRERVVAAEGFEIDRHYGEPSAALWSGLPLKLHLEDFTRASPPPLLERFNLIICNPPYVRHHHIAAAEKVRLQDASAKACGVRVNGLAGLYCYFLALSHAWMSEGGVAGWLIPSEFMDVNYGLPLKRYLLNKVTLLHIHRFDPNDVQFNDALVSSAVVWFRNERPPANHTVEFSYGGTLANPAVKRMVFVANLQAEPKWTRFPASDVREAASGVRLSDFFKIKRGLATGDNSFFIMDREQIEARRLPFEFFRPILPSPRYLQLDEIHADENGVPLIERPLFLLDCRLPEDEVKSKYPTLWQYLETGKPGVSERYLCKARKPWYAQENRPPTPFICTYMGRSDKKDGRPFRFILNHSQATAANVYLLLYPKPVLARALAKKPSIARDVWHILNTIPPSSLLGEGRVYGGGLHKLEPKELENVPAEEITALLPDEEVPATQAELVFAQPAP